MKVYVVSYRGTVYGVFDGYDKAWEFTEGKFGRNAMMFLEATILEKEVL